MSPIPAGIRFKSGWFVIQLVGRENSSSFREVLTIGE
jgi:hypothetical protein